MQRQAEHRACSAPGWLSMAEIIHASTTRHAEWGGRKRYIRVVIHPNLRDLQMAAERYRGGDFSQVAGCFHPAPERERYDRIARDWRQIADPHWAGVLRLARGDIHTEVVTHECVHAALAIYRMDIATVPNLSNGCGPREETLAYIIGDLTAEVVKALHDVDAFN